jgi:RHS repeat-associated protein
VAAYEYDAYGNVDVSSGTYKDDNPFRFSTKWFDDESGLGYWGLRMYSAILGRWASRDPINEEGGINMYVYANSAPSRAFDGLGLRAGCCCCVDDLAASGTWLKPGYISHPGLSGAFYVSPNSYGHAVTVTATLSARGGPGDDCYMDWQEYVRWDKDHSDKSHGWQTLPPEATSEYDWAHRPPVPSCAEGTQVQVAMHDWAMIQTWEPGVPLTAFRLLAWRIEIHSGCTEQKSCECRSIMLLATQILGVMEGEREPESAWPYSHYGFRVLETTCFAY